MGSRIMHYYIADRLRGTLGLEDSGFILGNLAPDVYGSNTELKDRSHFMKIDSDGIVYIDHDLFHDKYLLGNQSPFNLGYYFHLLSDDIWMNEIYYKKIKWLPPKIRLEAKSAYYRDFRRLNKKLISYYSLQLVPIGVGSIVGIEEIDNKLLPKLLEDLHADFIVAESDPDESLEILVFEEVIQVVEMTVKKCLAYSRDQTIL